MKPREQEILEQLEVLCEINEFAHFDISILALQNDDGYLVFENQSYSLKELKLSLHDIEWIERLGKIHLIREFRFKELKSSEIHRKTYSIFVPSKGSIIYESQAKYKWTPLPIISLSGALYAFILATMMIRDKSNLVGYDTGFGLYGYHTLTASGVIFLGTIFLIIGIGTIPKKKKNQP